MPIYESERYTTPEVFVKGYIREYDISKANISILLNAGAISEYTYKRLYNAPRMQRQIEIGKLQRSDTKYRDILKEGFVLARKALFTHNDLNEEDIISIRKDAIFILNKKPSVTRFGYVNFACKNTYMCYFRLPSKDEIYYGLTRDNEVFTVKGINDDVLALHENYFLDILKLILGSMLTEPDEETVSLIQNISDMYLNWKLDIGCYREFNNRSMFKTFCTLNEGKIVAFVKNVLAETQYIDTTYNYIILMELYKIVASNLL